MPIKDVRTRQIRMDPKAYRQKYAAAVREADEDTDSGIRSSHRLQHSAISCQNSARGMSRKFVERGDGARRWQKQRRTNRTDKERKDRSRSSIPAILRRATTLPETRNAAKNDVPDGRLAARELGGVAYRGGSRSRRRAMCRCGRRASAPTAPPGATAAPSSLVLLQCARPEFYCCCFRRRAPAWGVGGLSDAGGSGILLLAELSAHAHPVAAGRAGGRGEVGIVGLSR
jgi:hypothetical protein